MSCTSDATHPGILRDASHALFPACIPHTRHEAQHRPSCSARPVSVLGWVPAQGPGKRMDAPGACAAAWCQVRDPDCPSPPPPPLPAGELSRDDSLRCSEGKGPRAAGRRDTAAGHRAEMLKDGTQSPGAEPGCRVEGFWHPVGSLSLQLSPLRAACGLRGFGAGDVPSKHQPC